MPIVEQKAVIFIAREGFPQLLQRPFRCRMFGDIEVKQPSGSDLESNKYIEDAEAYRHGNEEVTGDHSTCVIADERCPALIRAAMRARSLLDVLPDRTW